eukprot:4430504-Prorocentrum_lima.AAC.1
MTSSLVGSEMCIRDRKRKSLPRLPHLVRGLPWIWLRKRRRNNLPRLPHPVSYTHLTLPTICSV